MSIDHSKSFNTNNEKSLQSDTIWSLVSLLIQALAGALFKVLVERHFGSEGLGVSIQILTMVAIFGLLGTMGVHQSLLQQVAISSNSYEISTSLSLAILVTAVTAVSVGIIIYFCSNSIGMFFDSLSVAHGLAWASPGISLLAINKSLSCFLVGIQHIQAFSISQMLRALSLLFLFCLIILTNLSISMVGLVISGAELIVCIWLIYQIYPKLVQEGNKSIFEGITQHLRFGFSALPGLIIVEANTKVDVLVLGSLLDDRDVGIYSIVSFIVEGIYSFYHAIRTTLTRKMSQIVQSLEESLSLRKYWLMGVLMGFFLIPAGILVYTLLLILFREGAVFNAAWIPLLVILIGTAPLGGYELLLYLPNQLGYPSTQSRIFIMMIFMNFLFCIILIPWLSLTGVALAMVLSNTFKAITVRTFIKDKLGIDFLSRSVCS